MLSDSSLFVKEISIAPVILSFGLTKRKSIGRYSIHGLTKNPHWESPLGDARAHREIKLSTE